MQAIFSDCFRAMDTTFLSLLGRQEPIQFSISAQFLAYSAMLTVAAFAQFLLLGLDVSPHFFIATIVLFSSRSVMSKCMESLNIWRLLPLLLPLFIYVPAVIVSISMMKDLYNEKFFQGVSIFYIPTISLTLLDNIDFSNWRLTEHSRFVLPLSIALRKVLFRTIDVFFSLWIIPCSLAIPGMGLVTNGENSMDPTYNLVARILVFSVLWLITVSIELGDMINSPKIRFAAKMLGQWQEIPKSISTSQFPPIKRRSNNGSETSEEARPPTSSSNGFTASSVSGASSAFTGVTEWSAANAPYFDGAVVRRKGKLYRAVGITTITPSFTWSLFGSFFRILLEDRNSSGVKFGPAIARWLMATAVILLAVLSRLIAHVAETSEYRGSPLLGFENHPIFSTGDSIASNEILLNTNMIGRRGPDSFKMIPGVISLFDNFGWAVMFFGISAISYTQNGRQLFTLN